MRARQTWASSQRTAEPKIESMPRKNTARMVIMMATKIAVREVSGQVGQTTLPASALTWLKNSAGLVLAIALVPLESNLRQSTSAIGPSPPRPKVREGLTGSDVGSRGGM